MPQRETTITGLRMANVFIREFPEVREAFVRDPMSFLEKYVNLDLQSLGITRADLPSREEIRRQLDSHFAAGEAVSIAICAVIL